MMVNRAMPSSSILSAQGRSKRPREEEGSVGVAAPQKNKVPRTGDVLSDQQIVSRSQFKYRNLSHVHTILTRTWIDHIRETRGDVPDIAQWRHVSYLDLGIELQARRRYLAIVIMLVTGKPASDYYLCIPCRQRPVSLPANPLSASTQLLAAIGVCLLRKLRTNHPEKCVRLENDAKQKCANEEGARMLIVPTPALVATNVAAGGSGATQASFSTPSQRTKGKGKERQTDRPSTGQSSVAPGNQTIHPVVTPSRPGHSAMAHCTSIGQLQMAEPVPAPATVSNQTPANVQTLAQNSLATVAGVDQEVTHMAPSSSRTIVSVQPTPENSPSQNSHLLVTTPSPSSDSASNGRSAVNRSTRATPTGRTSSVIQLERKLNARKMKEREQGFLVRDTELEIEEQLLKEKEARELRI